MEVLDSAFHDSTFNNDSPFIGDIDLQPPSPHSQGHIDLYNSNQDYHNSPFSSHSDLSEQLSFSGALFSGDDGYDPVEFDHPTSASSLLMFDDNGEFAEYMPYSDSSPFDYRSPSPGSDHNDQLDSRSRASSTSSSNTHFQSQSQTHTHHSPNMQVAHSFENLSFHSPHWNPEPLPQGHKPPSPPRLLMPDPPIVINAPDDGDLNTGPRLHIVPATPISGGGAATSEPPFQPPLETLRQGECHFPNYQTTTNFPPTGPTLGSHHMQPTWLDIDNKSNSSRAPSPAATNPPPSRSPSASPQPSHQPSPHPSHATLPFLFPGQPQPRSRSKSDTALEPPNWDTVQGYLNADQQQHRQQPQELNDRSAYNGGQTAHPPTLGQNFSFGPPASSAGSSSTNANNNGGFLSPDLNNSFSAASIRRSKSDSGGRHRTSRSEDIRPAGYDNMNGNNNNDGFGSAAGGGAYLYPPTSHEDFLLRQQGQQQQGGSTPQFLSPSMGGNVGLPQGGGHSGHGHSLSMGSHPGYLPALPNAVEGGRGGTHYRRASSGTRSERGTSVGAWDPENGGQVRIGANNRVSPYPSPNASPRGRYTELQRDGEFDFTGVGISGRGSQSMHQGGTGPLQGQGMGSLLQGPGGLQGPGSMQGGRRQPATVVSKPNVTTGRTANASHKRRKQEATFVCPVPGCGSTFTRSFNLKGVSICLGFYLCIFCPLLFLFSPLFRFNCHSPHTTT
jgi:hypothetical protein